MNHSAVCAAYVSCGAFAASSGSLRLARVSHVLFTAPRDTVCLASVHAYMLSRTVGAVASCRAVTALCAVLNILRLGTLRVRRFCERLAGAIASRNALTALCAVLIYYASGHCVSGVSVSV